MSEEGAGAQSVAPWIAAQAQQLLAQRGHAWLLAGPSGLGQYPLALALARAWLCERAGGQGACADCGSCHAIDVRTHADLCVLIPETLSLELGWPLSEGAQADIDAKKRKPSKEIRVDAIREALEFTQRTSARGRGKVVLVFPAERMNKVSANALLKSLEEPPGDVKFVLASAAAHLLLPTIRSRCLWHSMHWPKQNEALRWLQTQGIEAQPAQVLLRAAGGRPADALAFSAAGRDATGWSQLPGAMARGDLSAVKDWSMPELVDALHKLCHDLLARHVGGAPRFFAAADLPAAASLAALSAWSKALTQTMRTVEHPFQPGLMLEALVSQTQIAINSRL